MQNNCASWETIREGMDPVANELYCTLLRYGGQKVISPQGQKEIHDLQDHFNSLLNACNVCDYDNTYRYVHDQIKEFGSRYRQPPGGQNGFSGICIRRRGFDSGETIRYAKRKY